MPRMPERAPRVAVAVLCLLGVAGLSCRREDGVPRRPNVLLITLDTLRADHLSLYGYRKPTSPFLDRFARRGTRFDAAYATSNSTKPSHASLLTGLYPKHHGLLSNNDALLHEDVTTLPEIFRDGGYQTFAAVATPLLAGDRSGLAQGFESYDDRLELPQRRAHEVLEAARRQLDALDSRPFFGWWHFFDPHIPYAPPEELVEKYWEPAPDGARVRLPIVPFAGTSLVNGTIPQSSALGDATDPTLYEAAYDGEITFLDGILEDLFDELERRDLLAETIVAITADHGEMLGEQGIYYNHSGLYEPVVRVPMILVVPGRDFPPVVGAVVENFELAPTLLELVGLAGPSTGFDGASLVPLLAGHGSGDGLAFAQHSHFLAVSVRDATGALILPVPSPVETIVTPFSRFERSAYLRYMRTEAPGFYPRGSGSAESPSAEHGDDARRLEGALRAWLRQRRSFPQPRRSGLSAEEIEHLKSLGYL